MVIGVRDMTSDTGERWRFDPGSFCLDLLLTGGPGPLRRYEILHAPADLATWLTGSKLAAVAPLEPGDIRITRPELHRTALFRDTMWSIGRALAHGDAPEPTHLVMLNEWAGTPPRPRIDPATGERGWVTPVTGDQILAAAAHEAIDLVSGNATDGPSAGRVRECAADDCYLLFLDTSRPGNRRWCSMQRCGNRYKVRNYRTRLSS